MDTTLVKLYAKLNLVIEERVQELEGLFIMSNTIQATKREMTQRLDELQFIRKEIAKVFSEVE